MVRLLIACIRLYQCTISPVLLAAFGPVCRFTPSCSEYALACVRAHGAWRGTLLSLRRLCKCHPFHPGGHDPPPPRVPPPPGCPPPRDARRAVAPKGPQGVWVAARVPASPRHQRDGSYGGSLGWSRRVAATFERHPTVPQKTALITMTRARPGRLPAERTHGTR
jgi:putative membrane protein insertion efficiency factor